MKKRIFLALLLIPFFEINPIIAQCIPYFEEKNGKLIIEAENIGATGSWTASTSVPDFTGTSYITWEGSNSFTNTTLGVTSLQFKISSVGTYLFRWRTKVGEGTSSTDFNDTWLKFPNASGFYGRKVTGTVTSTVYPTGSGLTPNPNGAGANGFFKVYSSGSNTNWTWVTKVSDNDAHDVYVVFNTPGIYTMQIAARSRKHLIDRITLSRTGDATALTLEETTCVSLSTTEFDSKPLSIYPNPSITGIYNLPESILYKVYDATGKTILDTNSSIVDLSSYREGIYILKSEDYSPVKLIR